MDVIRRNNIMLSGPGGQPMLFAHGYGCDQSMWRFVAPAFADRYKVVLFDHVGAGRSDLSAYDRVRYASLGGYAADVIEICEALDLRHVVMVAHSVSAMIAVLASIRAPDRFAALVLLGPSPRYIGAEGYDGGFKRADIEQLLELQESNYLGWANTLAPLIIGDPEQRPELVEELRNSFCRTDPEVARQFAAVTFLSDNRDDLIHVRAPTLIIQSEFDSIASTAVGRYVHEHIPGSEMVVLPVSGHCPHLSAPQETIAAIDAFLARHVRQIGPR